MKNFKKIFITIILLLTLSGCNSKTLSVVEDDLVGNRTSPIFWRSIDGLQALKFADNDRDVAIDATSTDGTFYIDVSEDTVYIKNAILASSSISGIDPSNIDISEGAIIYGDSSNLGTELSSSTAYSILQMSSSLKPEWSTDAGSLTTRLSNGYFERIDTGYITINQGIEDMGIDINVLESATTTDQFVRFNGYTVDPVMAFRWDTLDFNFNKPVSMDESLNVDSGTFYVDNTNNRVGVGTTTPAFDIHAYDNNGSVEIVAENANSGGSSQIAVRNDHGHQLTVGKLGSALNIPIYGLGSGAIVNRDGDLNIINDGNDPIKFLTDETDAFDFMATEKMRIQPNGNVGIGTTLPSALLHVSLASTEGTPAISTITTGLFQRAGTSGSGNYVSILAGSAGVARLAFGDKDAQSAGFIEYDNADNSMTFNTNVNDRMIIDGSGNVGIGTAIPLAKFHVTDTVRQTSFTGMTRGTAHLRGTTATGDYSALTFGSSSSLPGAKVAYRQTALGGEMHFGTTNNYGAGITNDAMIINPSGNIGVGITAPYSRLSVLGITDTAGQGISIGSATQGFGAMRTASTGNGAIVFDTYSGSAWNSGVLRLSTTGFAGIGTDPSYRLHVKSASTNTYPMVITASDGSNLLNLYESASGNPILELKDASGTADVNLSTSGNSYFNGGNLGVGTTNPTYALEVSTASSRIQITDPTDSNNLRAGIGNLLSNGGFLELINDSNVANVILRSYGDSYIRGGRVGIGTASPATPLTVKGNAVTNTGGIRLIKSTTDSIYYDNYINTGGNLIWAYNGTDSLSLTQAGRLGLNVESPSSALHVVNVAGATTFFKGFTSDYVENTTGSGIVMQTGASSGDTYTKIQAVDVGGASVADLALNSVGGNVGIGITAPTSKLDISESNDAGNVDLLTLSNPFQTAGTETSIRFAPSSAPASRYSAISGIEEGGNNIALKFTTGRASTITEKMRLTSVGYLGIGTTTPNTTLDVTGGIRPGMVTADPCGGDGYDNGAFFYNLTAGVPCYCNNALSDLKVSDNSACF